jgi:hypothetical protein
MHKMLASELYNPLDAQLVAARNRARDLCQALNGTRQSQQQLSRVGFCCVLTKSKPWSNATQMQNGKRSSPKVKGTMPSELSMLSMATLSGTRKLR